MTEGKLAEKWDHTAALIAAIVNMHRDPKRGKAVDPAALNPYRKPAPEKTKIRLNKEDSMKLLKQVFIDRKPVNMNSLMQGKVE